MRLFEITVSSCKRAKIPNNVCGVRSKKQGRKALLLHTRRAAFSPQPRGRRIHAPGRNLTQPCASPVVKSSWTTSKHHPRCLSHAQKNRHGLRLPSRKVAFLKQKPQLERETPAERTRRTNRVGPKGG
ncbi:hypothetical protein FJTKL_06813 [Diaporthe vaccinii]|uniref:Uncharacterized protein n=1 Tax=Diaporthe vaccinii TaxID=105482 RepID=A0ABR4EVI1_9PEZI